MGTIISLLCYYLFDMNGDETRLSALPMAGLSWLAGLLLNLAVLKLLESML